MVLEEVRLIWEGGIVWWDCIGGGLIGGLLRGIDSGRSGSKVLMVVVVELVSWGNKMVG